ncbi:methyltransferase [Alteromonadaceae bacterium BrNp21-10]|nr:methyltransferase [Alteromonadaceae bacterium BrNp21-10]
MLSAPSKLLIKNQNLLQQGKWLIANPEDADIFNALEVEVDGFHQFYDIYQHASQQQPEASNRQKFSAVHRCDEQYDGIVCYMPKAKEHAKMLLANLASNLKTNGMLLLIGENKSGIKSAPALLGNFGQQVIKEDSARHCTMFKVIVDVTVPEFDLDQWQQSYSLTINQTKLQICSLPGVFNHGKLDDGTALLLAQCDNVPKGKLLDFACGAGIIGCYLGLKNPQAQITMSDISALALHCAEQSAVLNGIEAKVIASHGLVDITDKYNAIYTNPPFHTGVKTDYQVTESFIQQVKGHLLSKGSLTIVANAFLKYSTLLQQHLAEPKVLAGNSRFKVYRCQL